MTERTLARSADAIVAGTIRQIETVADAAGAIRTLVSVEVERTYKGAPHDLVMLREPGGHVGGRTLWIAGSPSFTVGERDLLFLSADPEGGARVTALGMGQYHLDGSGNRLRAERRLNEPVIGGARRRSLALTRLERTIARAVALDGPHPLADVAAIPPEATMPGLER